jgi:hypothetical protein
MLGIGANVVAPAVVNAVLLFDHDAFSATEVDHVGNALPVFESSE